MGDGNVVDVGQSFQGVRHRVRPREVDNLTAIVYNGKCCYREAVANYCYLLWYYGIFRTHYATSYRRTKYRLQGVE